MAFSSSVFNGNPRLDPDSPVFEHPGVVELMPSVTMCRDTFGGLQTVTRKGQLYLPKMEVEDPKDYDARIKRAEFYNAMRRTVRGYGGMVFRTPIVVSDSAPEMFKEWWDTDVDGFGNRGDVFARRVFQSALRDGVAGILTDFPEVPRADGGAKLTRTQEAALKLRPYWKLYEFGNILNWRYEMSGGEVVLTQLTLRDRALLPVGRFGMAWTNTYFVFNRAPGNKISVTEYIETKDKSGQLTGYSKLGTSPIRGQTEIPFSVFHAGDQLDFLLAEPPLFDLAALNIAWYQVRSDVRSSLHYGSNPIFTVVGDEQDDDTATIVGAGMGLRLPSGGSAYYVEHSGAAIGSGRTDLKDIEGRMAALGLSALVVDTRMAETAEAKRIDAATEHSLLTSWANDDQDTMERASGHVLNYMKQSNPRGLLTMNTDYDDIVMDPGKAAIYLQMYQAGALSLETMWLALQNGKLLPRDFKPEEELKRIMDSAPQSLPPAIVTDPNAPKVIDSGAPPA